MADKAEEGGLVFHPMDQFIIKPLFGGDITWYTPTNTALWMGNVKDEVRNKQKNVVQLAFELITLERRIF